MKFLKKFITFSILVICLIASTAPAFATVTVSSPTSGATVSSPVSYVATASTTTCAKGVASMGIYVNNKLVYVVNAAKMNTKLSLGAGAQHTVVEEWDHCGGASYTTRNITVGALTAPTVSIKLSGPPYTLTVVATNATSVTITGTNGSTYTLAATGGTQAVSPTVTTTYTATATGTGGKATASLTVTVTASTAPTVTISANPTSISPGSSTTLTVTATNATNVTITMANGTQFPLSTTGGTQVVSPTSTTTYMVTATGAGGTVSSSTTVTVAAAGGGSAAAIKHVVFMLQENHTFDNYFGMLNPYRVANHWNVGDDGKTYTVDGIDDKLSTISNEDDEGTAIKLFRLASTCIDDDSSAWLASYGDVNRYDFLTTRPINMDGFVHTAEGFAKNCASTGACSGSFTDLHGERAMGYYDQGFLNYYYYMASQFAVSNRWFSPIASKSIDNRIATYTGGTTQGLVQDQGSNDHLGQLAITTIFNELDKANVSWKIYYTDTDGSCLTDSTCGTSGNDRYPATSFSALTYSLNYLHKNSTRTASGCTAPLQPSSVVGDSTDSFCIDTHHIAPLSQYYTDLSGGALPSFAFIESGAMNDEHPGSGNSVLVGQVEVAKVINAFMVSPEWNDSVFFFSYDEGGGPYDHVPPVPGHSNDYTDASLKGSIPDIASISVSPDSYKPCVPSGGTATTHCDLASSWPGAHSGDAPAVNGFGAQIGFRVPNMVISPFTRKHYVSNAPMDHTAILKFVENRFIGSSTHLTARDAAQPDLLDFFDFVGVPWATPPSPPSPATNESLGYDACTAASLTP